MVRQLVVHCSPCLVLLALLLFPCTAPAQTADDVTKLIERLLDVSSIDLCKVAVKYRAGLEPAVSAVDADESAMKVLKNPHEVHGRGKAAAAGWYRLSFIAPEKLAKFPIRSDGW